MPVTSTSAVMVATFLPGMRPARILNVAPLTSAEPKLLTLTEEMPPDAGTQLRYGWYRTLLRSSMKYGYSERYTETRYGLPYRSPGRTALRRLPSPSNSPPFQESCPK